MKHILITGGSDGLGKITAKRLQERNHKVTILSSNPENARSAAEEIGCGYVVADVSDAGAVQGAIAQAEQYNGPIDILINNAGIWIQGKLEENDPSYIEQVFRVNTLGTIFCTHAVVVGMKQRGNGKIINVISQAGLNGKAERSVYNASKWAITGFTKSMQDELKPNKIAVMGFYPGALQTGLFAKAGYQRDMSKALNPAYAANALTFMCEHPDGITIPEFGITSLDY
jgi:short-subunit dehydrogenase